MGNYHLAQMNIATALYDMEDPRMTGFVNKLDEVNALAEQAPGFVWRLQSDSGSAVDIKVYDDPNIIINMSVWEDADSLFEYTYHTDHVRVFADRAKWFHNHNKVPALVLWWVPAGRLPDEQEGKDKLEHLRAHGPSPEAFTLKKRFPAPEPNPVS